MLTVVLYNVHDTPDYVASGADDTMKKIERCACRKLVHLDMFVCHTLWFVLLHTNQFHVPSLCQLTAQPLST